jgi:PhoH-like ATPase
MSDSKFFVVDTNVFLSSPNVLKTFKGNKVVISEAVIEELDNFKKSKDELGYCARETIRQLDEIITSNNVTSENFKDKEYVIDEDTSLIIEMNNTDIAMPLHWDTHKMDNRILQVCRGMVERYPDKKVILVSKDTVIRIKANQIGIVAEDYKFDQILDKSDHQYLGCRKVYVPDTHFQGVVDSIFKEDGFDVEYPCLYDEKGNIINSLVGNGFIENEFIILFNSDISDSSILCRYEENKLVKLLYTNTKPFGVKPYNVSQIFFIEALTLSSKKAPLVIAKGPSGTAKTFLSLAVGLDKLDNKISISGESEYTKILVCRPNIAMDEDLGSLPGDEKEKIAPLMRPIYDNLNALFNTNSRQKNSRNNNGDQNVFDYIFYTGMIDMQSVGFLRGRSIVRQWLIIDEAQNLTPNQVKGIITRAGIDTKVILIGDPDQIDSPFLTSRNNGLTYASEKMKNSKLCFQITMKESDCVRSELAKEAIGKL